MRRSLTAVFENTRPRLQRSGVGIHKVKQQSYNEIWTNNTFIVDVMQHYSHMIDVRLKLLRLQFPSNPSLSLYRTPNLEERRNLNMIILKTLWLSSPYLFEWFIIFNSFINCSFRNDFHSYEPDVTQSL